MLAEVKHQEEGTKFLRRFVEGKLVSPLLLIGDDGVGRRFSVRHAVQEALCLESRASDCRCYSCLTITNGLHPDFTTIHAEGDKDLGIDTMREVISMSKDYPSVGKVRCFLIDGVDRLTAPAANAFLKTLEEPPAKTRFFLLSEFVDQVIPTIRSRCGRVRYNALPEAFVLSVLHQYESDAAKALVYARMGEGSVGRSVRYWSSGRLGLRDQVFKVLQLALDRDLSALFSALDGLEQDLLLALKFLEHLLHDVFMARIDPMHLVNADLLEQIIVTGKRAPLGTWMKLSEKVRALQHQYRSTRLHLSFHVKSILIESFI